MRKLPLSELKELWQDDDLWGNWRNILKNGYKDKDIYFEFGVMLNTKGYDAKIVINHCFHLNFSSNGNTYGRNWTLIKDGSVRGFVFFKKDKAGGICKVGPKLYDKLLEEVNQIYTEYADEEFICFWSIPNKWFADKEIVKLIEKHLIEDIPSKWGKKGWYWP